MRKAQDQMQRRASRARASAGTLTLAVVACLALLVLPAGAAASDPFGDLTGSGSGTLGTPTISSDKADYAPGETVVLTGDNWLPGEHVHITVNDSVGQTWVRDSDVNADESGSIRDEFQLPTSFIAEYSVTATGDASGTATTTFTDGNVKVITNDTGTNTFTFALAWVEHNGTNSAPQLTCNSTSTATGSEAGVGNQGGAVFSKGVGNNNSIVLKAADTASDGRTFTGWSGETSSDTFLTRPDAHEICVPGNFTSSRTYIANYAAAPANSAPTVTRDNASRTVDEGQTATNTGTWADANAGDTVTLSASVGTVTKNADGTWSWSYATTDGPAQSQNVTITATDNHGASNSVTFALTVANVAPTLTAPADQTADEGSSKSFNLGSFGDPGADTPWAVDVDWGDGTPHTTFNATSIGTLDTKSHTYADDKVGGYTVTVKVTDKDGGSDTKTFKVTVANVAPTVTLSAGNTLTWDESTTAERSFGYSVSDPGADTVSRSFDCGAAGSYVAGSDTGSSFKCKFSDGGADPGTDTDVKVSVDDGDGGQDSDTQTVTVKNVAPTVTAPADQTADEGTSKSFNLGSFGDPGPDSPWAVDVDWGDGTPHTTFNATSTGTLDTKAHTYADDQAGGYTVTVKVTDKDGGSDTKTFKVTVANVAPTVTLTGPETADEGDTKSYSYTWTDPGAGDTFPAAGNSVDCGPKGTASAVVFTPAAKTGSFDCKFSDDSGAGTFEVKATVTDDDGGAGSGSKQVAVANVAPTASNGTFVVDPVFGTATAGFDFSDVGFGDTHSSSYFSWSDVGNRVATVTETNGTGHASDVRTLDPGCYELTVTGTAKDDDGATSAPPLVLHSGAQTSVYVKGFRPPIVDNERNIAKYGNVVPVKVVLTNTCTGATVTNVPLFVTTHLGTGGEVIEGTEVVTESVSAADSGSQMRTADGMYIYNLSTRSMTAGKDYTIRIRPNSTTAPWILQAVLQPKK
jgi:PKD domain